MKYFINKLAYNVVTLCGTKAERCSYKKLYIQLTCKLSQHNLPEEVNKEYFD